MLRHVALPMPEVFISWDNIGRANGHFIPTCGLPGDDTTILSASLSLRVHLRAFKLADVLENE